jgi:hypothetical protein
MTTPPVLPISESNDSTVARCCDGIMSLMYADRIGVTAANSSPDTASRASASQKLCTTPSSASTPAVAMVGQQHRTRTTAERGPESHCGEPTRDLRAGHDRCGQAGDRVGLGVAVEVEQERLEGVEDT